MREEELPLRQWLPNSRSQTLDGSIQCSRMERYRVHAYET
jgi:hypothetical protein